VNRNAFHSRTAVLGRVVDEVNSRRDGVLPMHLAGVAETFTDELGLVGALQLRWHARLAGEIERALDEHPDDLEAAVLTGWRRAATELPGVRAVLDAYGDHPSDERMARALTTARRKDRVLMAAMAGRASAADAGAVRMGRRLEEAARARTYQAA
jgi:hypothetical protein